MTALEQKRASLVQQQAALTTHIAQMTAELGSANAAITGGVKTIIVATYNRRFADYAAAAGLHERFVFPTTEVVADNGSFYAYRFQFLNKKLNFFSDQLPLSTKWYDGGNYIVRATRIKVSGTTSIAFSSPETVLTTDINFQSFISFLEAPVVGKFVTGYMLDHEYDFDLDDKSHMRDLFSQVLSHKKGVELIFMPGSYSGMTLETPRIRSFWLEQFGQTILQAVGVNAGRNQSSAAQVASRYAKVTNEGGEFDVLAARQLSSQASATFGRSGYSLMTHQIQALDDAWVKELEQAGLPIIPGPHVGVRGEEVVQPIYIRWSWADTNERKSAAFLQNLHLDRELQGILLCISANFMKKNDIAPALGVTQFLENNCGADPETSIKSYVKMMVEDEHL